MPIFSVGEIAIFIPVVGQGQYIDGKAQGGEECEIISEIMVGVHGPSHYCDIPGDPSPSGKGWIIPIYSLRKRPPKEDARKWFDENIKLLVEA